MCDGKKVTHVLFKKGEYVYIKNRVIVSEDGVEHPNFWLFRADSAWLTGWKTVE